jgi:hypothetical protein
MDQHNATPDTEPSSVGRRTVLKGAAWSVPVVAVVGATPALAVSNLKLTVTEITAKRPSKGSKYVDFTISVSNTNSVSVDITDISFATNTGWDAYTDEVTDLVGASGTATFSFRGKEGNASDAFSQLVFTLVDSRGKSYNLTVTIHDGSVGTSSETVTFS